MKYIVTTTTKVKNEAELIRLLEAINQDSLRKLINIAPEPQPTSYTLHDS